MSSQGGQDPKISDPMAPCSVKMLNELHTILKGVHGLVSYTFHIPGLYPWWLGIAESEYPLGKKWKGAKQHAKLGMHVHFRMLSSLPILSIFASNAQLFDIRPKCCPK